MKEKQDLEMEAAHLKTRKEQLELNATVAASDAKMKICADYEDGHDGMNDYYESECKRRAVGAQQQTQLATANIRVSTHVPVHRAVSLGC